MDLKISTVTFRGVFNKEFNQKVIFHLIPVVSQSYKDNPLDKRDLPLETPFGTIVSIRLNNLSRGFIKKRKNKGSGRSIISGEISDGISSNYNFNISKQSITLYGSIDYNLACKLITILAEKIEHIDKSLQNWKETKDLNILKNITPYYSLEKEQDWLSMNDTSCYIGDIKKHEPLILEKVEEVMSNGCFEMQSERKIILSDVRDYFRSLGGWDAIFWDGLSSHVSLKDEVYKTSCTLRGSGYISLSGSSTQAIENTYQKLKEAIKKLDVL